MRNILLLVVCCTILILQSFTFKAHCKFEDGFYECNAQVIDKAKGNKSSQHPLILEIEGCLVRQIVSIDNDHSKGFVCPPKEVDDSGIVEIEHNRVHYVVKIGKEIQLKPNDSNLKQIQSGL